jgi:hypothetical protein
LAGEFGPIFGSLLPNREADLNTSTSQPSKSHVWIAQRAAEEALRAIAPIFEQHNIPLCPVKGVVLARWLYIDIAERPLCDVDLLVRRRDCTALRHIIRQRKWKLVRDSEELGELAFVVGGMVVEAHAEVVRRDLTTFTAEDFLGRSSPDSATFGFEIRRLDDVDHILLLLIELVKDWFVEANAHQPEDAERLLRRVAHRTSDLIVRAHDAGFTTGLHNAARWLADKHRSEGFRALLDQLGPPPRKIQPYLVQRLWKAKHPSRTLGLALSCSTNDSWLVRSRCVATIVRRRLWRAAGWDPG